MSAPSGSRSDRGAPEDEMRHVVDSAIFELSLGNGSPHWPDELELARIVETDLMQVVNEVFDERSRASGSVHIDRLEVDLGSLAFDGSWTNLRERIREGLRAALAGTKQLTIDRPGAESSLHQAGFLSSTGFDLLEHFLRFGVLPQHTQLRDRRSLDALLRDIVHVQPQRLAALLRDDAVGGVVAARLARQFPDALVWQIIEALGAENAALKLQMIGQVSGHAADHRAVAGLTGDRAGDADVSPAQTGDGAAVITGSLEWRQAITAHTQRVDDERVFYRQVRGRLLRGESIDLETDTTRNIAAYGRQQNAVRDINALMRPLSGSERLFRAYDLYAALAVADELAAGERLPPAEMIDELARDHPQQFQRLLLELRTGILSVPQIAARLSVVELRSLLMAFVMPAAGSADADRRRFLHSIDDHAGRAPNERSFYLQVLQNLVDGDLVDLEAIASNAVFPVGQDVQRRDAYHERGVRSDPPDATTQISSTAAVNAENDAAKQALRDYLGDGVVLSGLRLEALRRAAARSLELEPGWFAELLQQSLKGEKALARLVGLLPERLLARALYLLNPAGHERTQRYADAMASACNATQIGIAAARITELKWRFCLQQTLEAGPQWEAELFVQRFADFLAAHTPAGAPTSNSARLLLSDPRRFAGFLWQSLAGESEIVRLAGIDRWGAGDSDREDYQVPVPSGATGRVIEPGTTREEPRAKDATEIRALFESGIRIANAGQILAAPYLPRLFAMLDLVEDGAFKRSEAQARAVHLLQFMVDGTSDTPEYGLVLNKLLCGLDGVGSVNRGILVADAERDAIEGLLRGMVQHWQALGRTSVNGFRESFLQREGRLRLDSNGWHLAVDPKAFDMLLDRIPWSFSIVKHSWMNEVIYVDWR